jgi:hypothetical protein
MFVCKRLHVSEFPYRSLRLKRSRTKRMSPTPLSCSVGGVGGGMREKRGKREKKGKRGKTGKREER